MEEPKIRLVLASHGGQAEGMLDTVQMLLGPQENMAAYRLSPEETKETLTEKLRAEIEEHGAGNIIFFTDLLNGSPFNAVTDLTREYDVFHISGVNTITLMTAILTRSLDGATTESVCAEAMEASKNSIVDVRALLAAAGSVDEEEDDL